MEDFLFLIRDGLEAVWCVSWYGVRVPPCSTLIDLQELLGNILNAWRMVNRTRNEAVGVRGITYIVVAVEQNQ